MGLLSEEWEESQKKLSERFFTNTNMEPMYDPRPCVTRCQIYPVNEYQRSNKNRKTIIRNEDYDYQTYHPKNQLYTGTRKPPISGYLENIHVENVLRHQFFTNQKCEQKEYVPNMNSDLYNEWLESDKRNPDENHPYLFQNYELTLNQFNPNKWNLGNQQFHNHTRNQLRNA